MPFELTRKERFRMRLGQKCYLYAPVAELRVTPEGKNQNLSNKKMQGGYS